jgi:uncharacterized protein (TIGR02996 family)
MTSLDQQALIHAIASSPADDTPKLLYADWLDENGFDGRLPLLLRNLAVDDPTADYLIDETVDAMIELLPLDGGDLK